MKSTINKNGYFGEYGGCFVPQNVEKVLEEVKAAFYKYKDDEDFKKELDYYNKYYVGRDNPLFFAQNITNEAGGAKIYLKREDLNHTGAHKINNCLGQALLAKRMGKKRIIAETGAGQHGVATATVCAYFGMECVIYMGAEDIRRQELNVFRMRLLGAEVKSADFGMRTLKEAVDAAFEDLVQNSENTFYMLGSAVGPDPYPEMVKHFQSVIGKEIKEQIMEAENRLPDYVVACVGGGSNAIGAFSPFYDDKEVKLLGVEPAGHGLDTNMHAASITLGKPGVIHGFKCYLLQDSKGEPLPVYSIAPGLDYPGVGPEHCFYKDSGRAEYTTCTDQQALDTFVYVSRTEGIIPAIESSHALYAGIELAKSLPNDKIVVIVVSGRGDKDVNEISQILKQRI